MRTPLLAIGASVLLAVPSNADITLNFDSGWISGGEMTDITSGNTVSGVLTGLVFDLEFDTVLSKGPGKQRARTIDGVTQADFFP